MSFYFDFPEVVTITSFSNFCGVFFPFFKDIFSILVFDGPSDFNSLLIPFLQTEEVVEEVEEVSTDKKKKKKNKDV